MKLSILIPLFNEAESLQPLYDGIASVMKANNYQYEVVFVDDGSTDGSFAALQKLHAQAPGIVKVVQFSRNCGKSAGLSAGQEIVTGDIVITMDADLQDDPIAIPDMLKKLDKGFDVVSGWKKVRHDPVLTKNLPSKLFNFVTSIMSGVKLHDFNCGFKAYRAAAFKGLEIYGERHRYLPALAHWNGYKVTEVPVPHHARKFGVSKFGAGRFLNGPFDLLTIVFLRKYLKNPLHLFGRFGLIFVFAGLAVLTYFGVEWTITRQMHIRPLVLLSIGSIIMGIQFISIGLLGEMISHASPRKHFTIREVLK